MQNKNNNKRKLKSSFIEAISVHPVGFHGIFYETLQSIFEINFYVPRSIIFAFLIDPDVFVSLSIYHHHQSFKSVINDNYDYAKEIIYCYFLSAVEDAQEGSYVLQNYITNTLHGFDQSHKHLFYTHTHTHTKKYIFLKEQIGLCKKQSKTIWLNLMLVSLSN